MSAENKQPSGLPTWRLFSLKPAYQIIFARISFKHLIPKHQKMSFSLMGNNPPGRLYKIYLFSSHLIPKLQFGNAKSRDAFPTGLTLTVESFPPERGNTKG